MSALIGILCIASVAVLSVARASDYIVVLNDQVGATAQGCVEETDDTFAFFSNFGLDVDLAAPGVCITSTWVSSRQCRTHEVGDECYATLDGTSMSAPHVAGAAALYKATHPSASPAEVKAALMANWEPGPIPEDPDTSPEGVVNVSTF